jgi:hypothetical protein
MELFARHAVETATNSMIDERGRGRFGACACAFVLMGALPWNLAKRDMPLAGGASHDAYLAGENCHSVPASALYDVPEFGMVDKTGMWIAGGNEAETDVSEAASD